MAKPANSAEAEAPPRSPESPGQTHDPGGRGGYLGDRGAPRVWGRHSPGAARVRAPRLPTSQTLEAGPHVGQRRPGPGCTDSGLPRLAIGVVFSPGSPLGLRSPAPFPLPPLKPTPSPSMEARLRLGSAGVGPRLRPHASPRPSSHLRAGAPQPPELSLPADYRAPLLL